MNFINMLRMLLQLKHHFKLSWIQITVEAAYNDISGWARYIFHSTIFLGYNDS